jgi:hypothetical protein
MQLLHVDRVDPQSIDGIVEDSIASRLRSINSAVAGVVSTLALIGVAQQSSAARFAELHDAITKQHSMLITMMEVDTARDAQLAQHGERMARVEILFDKFDQQLPSLARCVEACSEFGPTEAAVSDPLDLDTAIPGLARSAGNNGAPHLSCFQEATTFRPGSVFPAGNRFPHTPDGGPAHADSDHR